MVFHVVECRENKNSMVTGFPKTNIRQIRPLKSRVYWKMKHMSFFGNGNMEGPPFFSKNQGAKNGEFFCSRQEDVPLQKSTKNQRRAAEMCDEPVAVLSGKKWMAIFGGLLLERHGGIPLIPVSNLCFNEWFKKFSRILAVTFAAISLSWTLGGEKKQIVSEIHFLKPAASLPMKFPNGWKMIHFLLGQFRPIFRRNIDFTEGTWRIIPVSKWLVTPIYKPILGHLEGDHPPSTSKDTRALQATRGPSRQMFRTIFRTLREDAETPHQEVSYVDPTKVDVQKNNWFFKPHLKFYELMIWWMMFHVQDFSSKMSSTEKNHIPYNIWKNWIPYNKLKSRNFSTA